MQPNKQPEPNSQETENLLLADFLQTLVFEDFSGRIDVVTSQEVGYVFLQNGYPVHAQFGKNEGDEALIELLQYPETILTAYQNQPTPNHSIQNKLEDLLIEAALRIEKSDKAGTRLIATKSHKIAEKTNCILELQIPSQPLKEYPVGAQEVSIGRASTNTIGIPNPSLSNHHALIFLRGGNYFIKDLNSSNGTQLNEVVIQEAELKNGDQIKMGEIKARFVSRLKRPQIQAQIQKPISLNKAKAKAAAYRVSQALRTHTEEMNSPSKKPLNPRLLIIIFVALTLMGSLYFLFLKR